MKKILRYTALLCTAFALNAQTADMFKPYQETDLRLPSVPLVVSDPYFSIWSPFDELNEGTPRHWTNSEKPLEGIVRVDGKSYRFLGTHNVVCEAIAPMADEEAWEGAVTFKTPSEGWERPNYNDSKWRRERAAFGSPNLENINTRWERHGSDIYIRRYVDLTEQDLQNELVMIYSHDDVFELYINGVKVADTGETWRDGVKLLLTDGLQNLLLPGKNLIAAHCHNTTGGAYADFGLYRNISASSKSIEKAVQKDVDVMATSSYYTFECGPVELDVVFTAPMLIDNYDLLSSPINYISYQVRSTDGKEHDVQVLLTASPQIAQNKTNQPTVSTFEQHNGINYVKTGTVEQPILAKKGDHICIDWGYLYMPAINGEVCLGSNVDIMGSFLANGTLPETAKEIVARKASAAPVLAYTHNFGKVKQASSYAMIGYDEIYDIEYFYKRYKAYWAHDGEISIFDMFNTMNNSYASIMNRCRALDRMIYDDGMAVAGKEYAEILSGSYRHVIAAHKLFKDDKGNLLFFSKENDSNGCVNTVDLTYPEAPLFLIYNPELQKAMMTSILDYSKSGRWTKPFAAHDLGTYPIANGQVYGGDMPLEEAGNMLTLIAMCSMLDGNTNYAEPYWDILQTWTDYLSENGQDPENQLCTDDFAGHWAHNANLSVKAIMGVAGFAEMAKMRGDMATYNKYNARAKEMATKWEADAREGSKSDLHYRLAFDRKDTWSQKYNMIWDKLWGTQIFPEGVMSAEVNYYLKKQNEFGLPLDCRRDYTKSDWVMWTAAMSPDQKTLVKFISPLYKYINQTPTRVPISDWYDTKTSKKTGFMARSVIAGHWMPVLVEKLGK